MWELGTIEGVGNLTCSREPFPHRASAHDEHKISSDDDIYHHSMQYFLERDQKVELGHYYLCVRNVYVQMYVRKFIDHVIIYAN